MILALSNMQILAIFSLYLTLCVCLSLSSCGAGNATRYCNLNSEWEEPIVINCLPRQFQSIRDRVKPNVLTVKNTYLKILQVNEIFQSGNLSTEQQLASSADVVMELAEATNVSANISLLPSALEVANLVMQDVINSLNVLKQQVQPDLLQVRRMWHCSKSMY